LSKSLQHFKIKSSPANPVIIYPPSCRSKLMYAFFFCWNTNTNANASWSL